MRLIDTQTLTLCLFTDPVVEPYAILSHTWTEDEVTFEGMQDLSTARLRTGFAKIEAACLMAISNGLQYVWVDTCCIDKSSSAELSEAINSMFGWYKSAVVCYAFLSDLSSSGQTEILNDLQRCKWFTRGWTLQELIAPTNLLFLDEEWKLRGTKIDLAQEIEAITGVDRWALNDSTLLATIPLAKRMSWAAGRQTTRVEDLAYCLMGIFDVNMPMIYGEGTKAFIRLQEEVLKKTTDLSLFAWQAKANTGYRGILAESPAEFLGSGEVVSSDDQFRFRDEISMTNKGVKINTALQYSGEGTYVMDLHCYREGANGIPTRIGIYLKRALDTYFRHSPHETAAVGVLPGNLPMPIFLTSNADEHMMSSTVNDDKARRICIDFPKDTHPCRVHGIKAVPETYWHANERFFSLHGLSRFKCFVRFCVTSRISPESLNYGTTSEESTQIILVCDLLSMGDLRVSLYAETGLQNSPKPEGFIDPFKSIEQYGPLGDPFSLSVLSPGDREDRTVSILHRDHRYNYVVTANLSMTQFALFRITVRVNPQNEPQMDPQYAFGQGQDKPPQNRQNHNSYSVN